MLTLIQAFGGPVNTTGGDVQPARRDQWRDGKYNSDHRASSRLGERYYAACQENENYAMCQENEMSKLTLPPLRTRRCRQPDRTGHPTRTGALARRRVMRAAQVKLHAIEPRATWASGRCATESRPTGNIGTGRSVNMGVDQWVSGRR